MAGNSGDVIHFEFAFFSPDSCSLHARSNECQRQRIVQQVYSVGMGVGVSAVQREDSGFQVGFPDSGCIVHIGFSVAEQGSS